MASEVGTFLPAQNIKLGGADYRQSVRKQRRGHTDTTHRYE
jgi:hypothetical protein